LDWLAGILFDGLICVEISFAIAVDNPKRCRAALATALQIT